MFVTWIGTMTAMLLKAISDEEREDPGRAELENDGVGQRRSVTGPVCRPLFGRGGLPW